jgi:hypothetical protein
LSVRTVFVTYVVLIFVGLLVLVLLALEQG